MTARRWQALLAGVWAGILLAIALIATPAPFATLPSADAGRVVGRIFAQEAYVSIVFALLIFFIERRRSGDGGPAFTTDVGLALGTLFCTVAGYFAIQPMLEAARAGHGPWSFGALHAASVGFFALKGLLVLALAWRLAPR
ncbi:MAG: DUF4149 domain-containing protein [Proteobacteria bacterium]|nr:DUF4149 domain-containing protein [Pseudomonadota bacterium]